MGRGGCRRPGPRAGGGVRALPAGVVAAGRPRPDGAAGARHRHDAHAPAGPAVPVGAVRRQRGVGPPPRAAALLPARAARPGARGHPRHAPRVGVHHGGLPGHVGLGGVPAAGAHRRRRGRAGPGGRRLHDGCVVAGPPRQLEHRRLPVAAVGGAVLVRRRRRHPPDAPRHGGGVVHRATAPVGGAGHGCDHRRRTRPARAHVAPGGPVARPGEPAQPAHRGGSVGCDRPRAVVARAAAAGLRRHRQPRPDRVVRSPRRPREPGAGAGPVAGGPRPRAPAAARPHGCHRDMAHQPADGGHLGVGGRGARGGDARVPAVAHRGSAPRHARGDDRRGAGRGPLQRLVGAVGPRAGSPELLPLDVRAGVLRGAGDRPGGGRTAGPCGAASPRRPPPPDHGGWRRWRCWRWRRRAS